LETKENDINDWYSNQKENGHLEEYIDGMLKAKWILNK
jgi:hypothetical protein